MRVTAGALAIVGAVVAVVACAVPFVTFVFGGHHQSASIFSPGPDTPGSDLWFVVEPVGVAALAIVGGVLLLAVRRGRLPAVAAGMLAAFGIQTVFLFLGYTLGYDNSGNQVSAGGPVGIVAGILLVVAGFLGLGSLRDQATAQNPAPGPVPPPGGAGAGAPPYPPA
jgi:hypothetical protein